jgi:hypothetical protein
MRTAQSMINQRKPPIKEITLVLLIVLLVIISLFALTRAISSDPEIAFLSDDHGAKWIRFDKPVNLGIWRDEYPRALFRRSFSISGAGPSEATLTIRAMKLVEVSLDGRVIAPLSTSIDDWKQERVVDLGSSLAAGGHELQIAVVNKYGPPLMIARSEALNLHSGEDWEASLDGSEWQPAVSAAEKDLPELSQMFPSATEGVLSLLFLLLPLFTLVFLLSMAAQSGWPPAVSIKDSMLEPSRIRWLLVGLWVALAINNIYRLPLNLGYDAVDHYEYISYVVNNHKIPLPSEGWQMFQSPLYYIISAGFYSLLAGFTNNEDSLNMLMRIIPLLCGALQIEVAYRAVRSIFPDRNDLQILGTIVGGLLPMNIYISQYVGNEPLAGLFSAMTVMMSLRFLQRDFPLMPKWYLSVLGLMLGLAMLAKATPVLLCLPLALFLMQSMSHRQMGKAQIAFKLLLVFGIAFAVCGWYYLRNWVELGQPFVGGWDLTRHGKWWQDPGYRTVQDFFRFGTSLQYPIYSGVIGFWDSIYSTFWLDGFLSSIITSEGFPPWNYGFMIAGALLSVLPSAGIILGVLRTLLIERLVSKGKLFAAACIGIYFFALLFMYVKLPIYTTAKATYTIGIIPCYAVACVNGLDFIMRNKIINALVSAIIVCWGVFVYSSFFVV